MEVHAYIAIYNMIYCYLIIIIIRLNYVKQKAKQAQKKKKNRKKRQINRLFNTDEHGRSAHQGKRTPPHTHTNTPRLLYMVSFVYERFNLGFSSFIIKIYYLD